MLRYLTAGESHGKALVVIVEGLPAGLQIVGAKFDEGKVLAAAAAFEAARPWPRLAPPATTP